MRTSSTQLINQALSKVPPSAVEVEKAILGVMLLEKDCVDTVLDLLRPDCFYVDAHKIIFQAIQRMAQKSLHIDLISVVQELKTTDELESAGGPYALTILQNGVTSSASVEQWCHIILEKYMAREMIRICGQAVNDAYKEGSDIFSLLDFAEQNLLGIGDRVIRGEMTKIDAVLVDAMNRIEGWRKNDSTITGVPSGIPKLDKITRGWQPGDLIILAARPSVGKTALALHLVDHAADNSTGNFPVAVWSLEMDAVSLVLRLLAKKSEMLLHRIQTGRMDDDQMTMLYNDGVKKLADLNIFFDDNPGLTLNSLRAKARRLKKKKNIGLILIDYLQLMSIGEDTRNREQEISKISRGLKNLAKELQVPIIALSQLSRDVEKRTGKKRAPQLSDLRESGAIEQDADVVIFLWAPDEEEIEADRNLENVRYVKIAKQRNGVLGSITLEFKNGIQKFKEMDDLPSVSPEKAKKIGLPSGAKYKQIVTDDAELF